MKYIVNGRIVMPDRIIDGKALAYDEKISGVVKTEDIPEGAEVIDAKGNYVCPGLVDIHIHGYLNEDTSDGKPEGIKKMAYGVAQNGVTAFLPTTMTVSEEDADSNYDLDNYEGTGYNISIDFFTSSSYTTSIQPGTYEVEPLDATTFSPKKIVSGFITEYEDEEEYYQYPAGTWLFKGDETVGGATAGNMVVSVSGSKYTITYSFHDDDLKVTFTGSYTGNLSIYDGTESYSTLAPVKAVKASKSAKLTKHFRVRR